MSSLPKNEKEVKTSLFCAGYRLRADVTRFFCFLVLRPANRGGGVYRVNAVEGVCNCPSRVKPCKHVEGLSDLFRRPHAEINDDPAHATAMYDLAEQWDECKEFLRRPLQRREAA